MCVLRTTILGLEQIEQARYQVPRSTCGINCFPSAAVPTDDIRPTTEPTATNHIPTSQSDHSSTSARSSLSVTDINTASIDFYAWLTEPPLPTEHMLRKVAPEAIHNSVRLCVSSCVRHTWSNHACSRTASSCV